jgi:ribonuclease BN (tRNA processing enzyme)
LVFLAGFDRRSLFPVSDLKFVRLQYRIYNGTRAMDSGLRRKVLKIHILGCGDAFGSGGRNQSGYLVESDNRLVLLDCGPTTLLAMKRAGIDPRRLDIIFLSHLHGDHFGGIPFFFLEARYCAPRRTPLQIAGPPGTLERIGALFEIMYPSSAAMPLPPTRFHIIEPDRVVNIEGIVVFAFRVPHQTQEISLGLKLELEGRRLLYSGDSAWTDLFIEHSQGVDLFLCECSFFNPQPASHIDYLTLQENLPRLGCRKLVLTHLGEDMLLRKEQLPVTLAEDGMVIEV